MAGSPLTSRFVYTYDILECIDPTEYAALVEAAKDGLRIILSCGIVDLSSTSSIRANLNLIFPVGKITRTKLDAL